MPGQSHRWSDDKLEEFFQAFNDHIATEKKEHDQQQALFNAVFQQEDKAKNIPAGLLQMMTRISEQQQETQKWQDRQKTFVGGIVFTVSSMWFVLSDVGPKLATIIKKVFA